jgi:small-conductance mechanosensitive channel
MDFALLDHPELWTWPLALAVCLAAMVAANLAFRIVRRVTRSKWFEHALPGQVLRSVDQRLQWLLMALALGFTLDLAPDTLSHIERMRQLAGAAVIVAFTLCLLRAIDVLADWVVARHPATAADNLAARRVLTQMRVVGRTVKTLVVLVGTALALLTFPAARKFGVSLLASAGVAGLIVGLAAKSVIGNLLAGLQIAFTQPIRLDDVLIVEGEWGHVEEITATYVVFRVWDDRRLIVPLQYFIEHPFQNWTRNDARLMGQVFLWLDYALDLETLRTESRRIIEAAAEYDRRYWDLHVVDTSERAMKIRIIFTVQNSDASWKLQCKVREGLIDYIRRNLPEALPRIRAEVGPGTQSPERAPKHPERIAH